MKTRAEDIVFIINPLLWFNSMYPLGILCLSGYLESKGFGNVILDSKNLPRNIRPSQGEEIILNKINEIKPKVVCFSSTHMEFSEVVRMNAGIKKLDDKIITIVGGPQPTYRAEDYLDNGFDFACIGAGEVTLYEFIRNVLDENYCWEKIRGLAWRGKGKNIFNPPRGLDDEFSIDNDISLPYKKIDKRYFDMNIGIIRGLLIKGALLLTTRGCPFSCSYCGCNLIFGRKLRFKPLKNIEREVECLKHDYGIEGIWIIDDTFTVNGQHVMDVCSILKKYNLIWGCQTRVDTINEKLIKIMKDSGCVQIDFGVESGSQRILDEVVGKGTTVAQTVSAFNLAKKYKLRTFANFMVGLPTETYEELEKTKEVADLINADLYLFSIATPLPGTRLYDMVNENINPHDYSLLDWNGSCLTEKLNRSQIKNVAAEKDRLFKNCVIRSKIKLILSGSNYLFFFKNKYKYQRLKFMVGYFIRGILDILCFRKKRSLCL